MSLISSDDTEAWSLGGRERFPANNPLLFGFHSLDWKVAASVRFSPESV